MTSANNAPIGILDSGMGGISIWAEIVRTLPQEEVVYWADTAHCPYGGRTQAEITKLVTVGVKTLLEAHAKIIVIACNTATTAAIATLRAQWPEVPFIGLEPAIKPAARATRTGVVGVLGTAYTVQSEMFRHTTEQYAQGVRVIATAGNGLVEQVENDREEQPETENLLKQYIEPMLAAGADQLVLACTHFPLLVPAIRRIIGNRPMQIINPAPAIARHTQEVLAERGMLTARETQGSSRFLSSGTEHDSRRLADKAEYYIATLTA